MSYRATGEVRLEEAVMRCVAALVLIESVFELRKGAAFVPIG
jgi:hypothetical protein